MKNSNNSIIEKQKQEEQEEKEQAKAFDKTTAKGEDGGLFQACMKSIRSSHAMANRLRMGLVVAGLFTDIKVYRETIAMFYLATRELETRLRQLQQQEDNKNPNNTAHDNICTQLLSLNYHFTPQYEQDLEFLYRSKNDSSSTWKVEVEKLYNHATNDAKEYIQSIRNMKNGAELAGAAFCLWGALIIGGGAVAMPRVQALCPSHKDEITHLFTDVTGPGRGERKAQFIQLWDSLAKKKDEDDDDDDGTENKKNFNIIVDSTKKCMQGNNALILSVNQKAWWWKYLVSSMVGVIAVGVYAWKGDRTKQS